MTKQATEHTEEEPVEEETPNPTEDTNPEPESPENGAQDDAGDEEEQFPRSYVEELREEAARHRTHAKDRDTLAHRLHEALVAGTGRLADPSDLDFDEAHLDDPEALTAALDELLTAKPHLASRKIHGDVGQGAQADTSAVDLAGLLRQRA
jgi:hypothetical protein